MQRPLYWHQGLFLQPQHFQQFDLYIQSLFEPLRFLSSPYAWGLKSIKIADVSLKNSIIELVEGEFVLKDGTWISVPENATVRPRALRDDDLESGKPVRVYIGIRDWNRTGRNVTVVKQPAEVSSAGTRFVTFDESEEVRDMHQGGDTAPVKTMSYALRIIWEDELDECAEYQVLPVAEIENADGVLKVSTVYIPPILSIGSSSILRQIIHGIRDRIASRCRKLEEYKSPKGIQSAQVEMSYIVFMLALRSLNRYVPLLYHLTETDAVHPWNVYGLLRNIIGELSTYTDRIDSLGRLMDGTSLLPPYDHEDIHHCFNEASLLIGELLETIVIGPESIIHMKRENGLFKAKVSSEILSVNNSFFLVLQTAESRDRVLETIRSIAKFSSINYMKILIERALPGLPLKHNLNPPPGLPKRPNSYYFEIDQSHAQWIEIRKNQSVCFYWDQAPNDTIAELVVMRK